MKVYCVVLKEDYPEDENLTTVISIHKTRDDAVEISRHWCDTMVKEMDVL